MRYYLKKSNNKLTSSNGRYVVKACHDQEVDVDKFAERIQRSCTLTKPDIVAALCAFSEEMSRCLRNGDKVRLPGLGLFKLELDCTPVDDPETFRLADHYRGVKLHVLPESKDGVKPLYDDLKLTRAHDREE